MREAFITKRWRPASLAVIETANQICADYQAQGFNLTLRQLYYQFVSRDLIPNTDRSYKNLGGIISNARLAGLMDWDYLTDRHREHHGSFAGWASPEQWIRRMVRGENYFEALWAGQDYRPEVWVEKDALTDVISRGCETRGVPYFACKGYVSSSAMYEAAKRFEQVRDEGLTPLVIHLGDHDPSGIDMTRDIRERLDLMSLGEVEVRRIALNMDQVRAYGAPPNPAKVTDSRAQQYISNYGTRSWELDALEPQVMVNLIRAEIDSLIDMVEWDEREAHQQEGRDQIQGVADRWPEIEQFLADNPVEE